MSREVSYSPIHLRLPATSANLGPGFDAAAIALDFFLEIEAEAAHEFSIEATGHDAERCGRLDDNLVLEIYKRTLEANARPIVPLKIKMANGIPLGMGCGSSAAGRLGALALANHFGALGWTADQILQEACALEGHPDNAAACWWGGFVTAAMEGDRVVGVKVVPPPAWRAIVVLPTEPLPTSKARAVLPDRYSRADVIANIQSVSLLGLAFAHARADLLPLAMADRIHQPYRAALCPLLPRLLPLAGTHGGPGAHGIIGVALSGAGPAVLVIVADGSQIPEASAAILAAVANPSEPALSTPALKSCRFLAEGTLINGLSPRAALRP